MTQWLLQHAGWIIVLAAVAFGSSWITQWWTPEPETKMLVNLKQEVFDEDDLVEPTQPGQVDVYEAPDTSDTQEYCFIGPEWLDTQVTQGDGFLEQLTNGGQLPTLPSSDLRQRHENEPSVEIGGTSGLISELAGLPYVITPMTQGRPSLSVGRTTVTLQSLSPKDGRILEWTYEIPQPSWRIGLRGTVAAGPRMNLGLSTIGYGRRFDLGWMHGWVDLGGGYGVAAVKDRVATGPVGEASIMLTLLSR